MHVLTTPLSAGSKTLSPLLHFKSHFRVVSFLQSFLKKKYLRILTRIFCVLMELRCRQETLCIHPHARDIAWRTPEHDKIKTIREYGHNVLIMSIDLQLTSGLSGAPFLCPYDNILPYSSPLSLIPHTVATTQIRFWPNLWIQPKFVLPLHHQKTVFFFILHKVQVCLLFVLLNAHKARSDAGLVCVNIEQTRIILQ